MQQLEFLLEPGSMNTLARFCQHCTGSPIKHRIDFNFILFFLYFYSAFLCTQRVLHRRGISSTTTNVQHPLGWCDGSHIVPVRPPHTSLLMERRQSDADNQCMYQMIRRPWWLEANREIWSGFRGNTLLFFEGHHGFFNYHREPGLMRRTVLFYSIVSPSLYWGVRTPQTTGWAPPAGLTNTTSSSNLVFPGGLPSRYWPGSTLLRQPVLGCRVICCWL